MVQQLGWIFAAIIAYAGANKWYITPHQQEQISTCRESTVCSEISEIPFGKSEPHYFSKVMCHCPSGSECPKQPGEQAVQVTDSKWYGMCDPVSEIGQCAPGDLAEDKYIAGREMFTRVHCLCPHGLEEQNAGMEKPGDSLYKFYCSGGMGAEKRRGGSGSRGRYGGSNGRRFYFYRK